MYRHIPIHDIIISQLNTVNLILTLICIHFLLSILDQPSFDKEFFAQYGQQTRPSNTDVSYQQQTSTSSQSTQDTPITTSKLSPTAAAFSQGAPLTSSPSNTTFYVSPMPLSMPNYHPDRGFSYSHAPPPPPLDNRVSISNHYFFFWLTWTVVSSVGSS